MQITKNGIEWKPMPGATLIDPDFGEIAHATPRASYLISYGSRDGYDWEISVVAIPVVGIPSRIFCHHGSLWLPGWPPTRQQLLERAEKAALDHLAGLSYAAVA